VRESICRMSRLAAKRKVAKTRLELKPDVSYTYGPCGQCREKDVLKYSFRFCSDRCEQLWINGKQLREQVGGLACMFTGCVSGLPVSVGGRYCSAFCQTQQEYIVEQRIYEVARRLEAIHAELGTPRLDEAPLEKEAPLVHRRRINAMYLMKLDEAAATALVKEVDSMVFVVPVYRAPIEEAANLFGGGGATTPRVKKIKEKKTKMKKTKTVVNTNDAGGKK
jgi:hypothetical protein